MDACSSTVCVDGIEMTGVGNGYDTLNNRGGCGPLFVLMESYFYCVRVFPDAEGFTDC